MVMLKDDFVICSENRKQVGMSLQASGGTHGRKVKLLEVKLLEK